MTATAWAQAPAQPKPEEKKPATATQPAAAPKTEAKPAATTTSTTTTTTTSTTAEIGKPAPDFTLKSVDGKEVKLSSFKGKVVVLEWINHECPVVNRVYGANTMAGTIEKFKGQDVIWLAIDSSNFAEQKIDSIKKWVADKKITSPYLLDASGKVGKMFGAKTTPHMFVIDKNGVLAYAGAIDDDESGSKTTKRNYVEEAVTALLKGTAVATPTTKSYGCTVKYKE
jgi:peroxiredoxin